MGNNEFGTDAGKKGDLFLSCLDCVNGQNYGPLYFARFDECSFGFQFVIMREFESLRCTGNGVMGCDRQPQQIANVDSSLV